MEAYVTFVKKLVVAFDAAGLDYAFTGALAVSFYGVPRTTTDVDVLVAFGVESDFKVRLVSALVETGLEADERKIENALASAYNIATFKHKTAPYTIDVILSCGKLDKKPVEIDGLSTFFQSPEGLVAAKLRMIKATMPPERSVKDKEDVKAILAFTKVDLAAVKKQAREDCTLEIFQALAEAD